MGSFLEDFSRFVTLEFSIARALCKWPGRMAIKLEAILQTGIMMTLVPETETDRVFQSMDTKQIEQLENPAPFRPFLRRFARNLP